MTVQRDAAERVASAATGIPAPAAAKASPPGAFPDPQNCRACSGAKDMIESFKRLAARSKEGTKAAPPAGTPPSPRHACCAAPPLRSPPSPRNDGHHTCLLRRYCGSRRCCGGSGGSGSSSGGDRRGNVLFAASTSPKQPASAAVPARERRAGHGQLDLPAHHGGVLPRGAVGRTAVTHAQHDGRPGRVLPLQCVRRAPAAPGAVGEAY